MFRFWKLWTTDTGQWQTCIYQNEEYRPSLFAASEILGIRLLGNGKWFRFWFRFWLWWRQAELGLCSLVLQLVLDLPPDDWFFFRSVCKWEDGEVQWAELCDPRGRASEPAAGLLDPSPGFCAGSSEPLTWSPLVLLPSTALLQPDVCVWIFCESGVEFTPRVLTDESQEEDEDEEERLKNVTGNF